MKIKAMEKVIPRIETGKKCPTSGVWKVVGSITTTRAIAKDQLMPAYCGKTVCWELLYRG